MDTWGHLGLTLGAFGDAAGGQGWILGGFGGFRRFPLGHKIHEISICFLRWWLSSAKGIVDTLLGCIWVRL